MNAKTILIITFFSIFVLGATNVSAFAFEPYLGNVGANGDTGANTLEEILKIKHAQTVHAYNIAHPIHIQGSDQTFVYSNDYHVGYILIIGIVVSIATGIILIKSRSGKYADMNSVHKS